MFKFENPRMDKSFSLFVEQDPGSSSSPADFKVMFVSTTKKVSAL